MNTEGDYGVDDYEEYDMYSDLADGRLGKGPRAAIRRNSGDIDQNSEYDPDLIQGYHRVSAGSMVVKSNSIDPGESNPFSPAPDTKETK